MGAPPTGCALLLLHVEESRVDCSPKVHDEFLCLFDVQGESFLLAPGVQVHASAMSSDLFLFHMSLMMMVFLKLYAHVGGGLEML